MGKWRKAALILGAVLEGIGLLRVASSRRSLPVPNVAFVIKTVSMLHRLVYRLTGGRVGGTFAGAPVLLLTTTGARSGQPRTTPLLYLADGPDFVVAASNGGADRHPGWWRNLLQHPEAEIQIGEERRPVIFEQATPEESRRLWPRLMRLYPDYAVYQQRTSREIPLAILRPLR